MIFFVLIKYQILIKLYSLFFIDSNILDVQSFELFLLTFF